MRLAQAIRLALSLASLPLAALADGQIYVYGYDDAGLTDQFSVRLDDGPETRPAAGGAAALNAAAGTRKLVILRDQTPVIEIPVALDDGSQRSVLVTLKEQGVSYVVQDTASGEELASGGDQADAPGHVHGVVLAATDGTPVVGAKVDLLEAGLQTQTDATGAYSFDEVPPGSYTFMIDAEGFQAYVQDGFALAARETVEKTIRLVAPGAQLAASTEDSGETTLEGVSVTGQQQGSQEAASEEKRSTAGVAEVLSAEQLSRGGESEAGAALKRVTGLSLVGGKFVYVRGLGERYSSVLLNGAQIPSPDPLRRVVPLDLFPTEVLDSVLVQKTYSPELPGEFGGGTVQLRTREAPSKRYARIAVGGNYVDGTSWSDGLRYDGGTDDYTGRDEVRQLPPGLAELAERGQVLSSATASSAEIEAYGEQLAAKGFDLREAKLDPGASVSASVGGSEELGGVDLSLLTAVRYQNAWDSVEELRRVYGSSNAGQIINAELERERTERTIDLSAFINLGADFGSGQQLQFTHLLLRQTVDQAQLDEGYTDAPEDRSRFYELEWVENSMVANQLSGSHYFNTLHELSLDWQYTDARAAREAPAKRRYRYDLIGDTFEFSRRTAANEYTFEDLDDGSREYRLNAQMPFSYGDNWFVTYALGGSRLERDRVSDIRRFTYTVVGTGVLNSALLQRPVDQILTPANIGRNGFDLRETTRSIDNYTASQTLDALYLTLDANFADRFRIAAGVRREANDQDVRTFDLNNPLESEIRGGAREQDWLPSLALTWMMNDVAQVRFGYARTLSRPDFRELSPAPFFDPILDVESTGNPLLKQTRLDNFDLRYEHYLSAEEGFSAAVFYKKFSNPIERTSIPGTAGLLSYENAEAGKNYGLEVEGFKRLGFVHERLEDVFVGANAAYIKSDVELGTAGQVQTNRNRPLQGQSEYLVNLQLGYKPLAESKLEATLLYNVAGKRIAQVGVLGLPDVYEQPFNQVDFTLKYRFNPEWTLGLRLRNLLDEAVEFSQGGLPTRRYEPGREIGLNVEWRPFAAD